MATDVMDTAGRGLEGIVVAETTLSMVDGTNGRLTYRGYSIGDLARQASFEEILALLWYGELPAADELAELHRRLVAARELSPAVTGVLDALPRGGEPIDALRAGVTALAMEDPTAADLSRDAVIEKSIRLASTLPTMLARYDRLRRDEEPIAPDASLGHAANFLYMLRGASASEVEVRALETYLMLLAEHSMNASTFSARVTISTVSDLYSAIATALGTLKGDAHGGANRRAMEMLLEIGTAERADQFVEESLRRKRRLMGFGHRIYKTRDPRVDYLLGQARTLAEQRGGAPWVDLAERLEQITTEHPYFVERRLYPNVEFCSAPLLYTLGFAPDLMPAIFALSRIGGWTAHVLEQLELNRIYRPQARYVGPEARAFPPLAERV